MPDQRMRGSGAPFFSVHRLFAMSDYVQLILVVEASAAAQELLAAVLPRGPASCVLILPAGSTEPPIASAGDATAGPDILPASYEPNLCRELVALIQSHNVAALMANDIAAAAAAAADGCQLDTSPNNLGQGLEERYAMARTALGINAIVGVMPGPMRHTAMTLAENGADYIGYNVSIADDDAGLELVQWWAEIFEAPVVAFTNGHLDICRRAIEIGPPDFLAVPLRSADDIAAIDDVAALIAECGQLPVAEKNAK